MDSRILLESHVFFQDISYIKLLLHPSVCGVVICRRVRVIGEYVVIGSIAAFLVWIMAAWCS